MAHLNDSRYTDQKVELGVEGQYIQGLSRNVVHPVTPSMDVVCWSIVDTSDNLRIKIETFSSKSLLVFSSYHQLKTPWRCDDASSFSFLFMYFGCGEAHSPIHAGVLFIAHRPSRWKCGGFKSQSQKNTLELHLAVADDQKYWREI